MRRPLPDDLTFAGLFGPQRDYDYFGLADRHAFPAALPWWLAEASLLAYVPETDFVRATCARAGFTETSFFDCKSTHAFVASRADATVVAFRGTETHDLEDLKTDLKLLLAEDEEGRVHRGFREALELIWNDLAAHLGARPCWFAGHSLGGALAVLAASRYPAAQEVCTYGCPRVGDARFRDGLEVPVLRFVNKNDIVARLPPPVLYHHVGRLRYIDRHGDVQENPGLWERVKDQLVGHKVRAVDAVGRWLRGDLKSLPYDSLVDHSPLHYAIHLRNAWA